MSPHFTSPPVVESIRGVQFAPSQRQCDRKNLQEEKWNAFFSELSRLHDLEDDWDGMGATAPTGELLESAQELAQVLKDEGNPPPCRVVPEYDGGVIFEWQDNGVITEIEISKPGFAEGTQIIPGAEPKHFTINGAHGC